MFLAPLAELAGGLAEGGAAAGAAEGAGAAAGAAEGGAAAGGGGGLSGMLGKFSKLPGMQALQSHVGSSFMQTLPFAMDKNRNLNQNQFGGIQTQA